MGDVGGYSNAASSRIAKRIARGDLAHRIGPGWNLQCRIDSAGNGSLVENTLVTVFQIPKSGDVCACSTATTGQIARRMARQDSMHWIGPDNGSKSLTDWSCSTSKVVNVVVAGFQIPKIGDTFACSTTSTAKRMARQDLARWVCLVHDSKGLADFSWGTSKAKNIAVAGLWNPVPDLFNALNLIVSSSLRTGQYFRHGNVEYSWAGVYPGIYRVAAGCRIGTSKEFFAWEFARENIFHDGRQPPVPMQNRSNAC